MTRTTLIILKARQIRRGYYFPLLASSTRSNEQVIIMSKIRNKAIEGLAVGDTFVVTRQFTEADMQEAAKTSLLNDAEKAAQNPAHLAQKAAQYPAAPDSKGQQVTCDNEAEKGFSEKKPALCGSVQGPSLPGTGVEPARPEGH